MLSALEAPGQLQLPITAHFFCGSLMHPAALEGIRCRAGALRKHKVILAHHDGFCEQLARVSHSIAMCGYNTAFELLSAQVPQLCFVPRQRTEQLMRAALLERNGFATTAGSTQEIVDVLRSLVEEVRARQMPAPLPRMDGAGISADLLASLGDGDTI